MTLDIKLVLEYLRDDEYTKFCELLRPNLKEWFDHPERPIIETYIASDPMWATIYALGIIKNRWPKGEPTIASDPMTAFRYASHILKGRFELGEPAIATSAHRSYEYATEVIHQRFPLGEPSIEADPSYLHLYKEHPKIAKGYRQRRR